MTDPIPPLVRVSYLELREAPAPPAPRDGPESIARERLDAGTYLDLYGRVGAAWRWDQRFKMPAAQLAALLDGDGLAIYVLRDGEGCALGFCEWDRREFPQIELKNFGLLAHAQGRRLGPWLLAVAAHDQWRSGATRLWLHTDTWDHPAAVGVYLRAGFSVYAVRDEDPGPL
jgi:GNAT superfamily N-acetyltransferase